MKNEKADPRKVKTMCGRVYRLRILQGKAGNPDTIARYEREEEGLLKALKTLGIEGDAVEAKAFEKLPEPKKVSEPKSEPEPEKKSDEKPKPDKKGWLK